MRHMSMKASRWLSIASLPSSRTRSIELSRSTLGLGSGDPDFRDFPSRQRGGAAFA